MKINKSLLTAAMVSSSLAMSSGLLQADGDMWRYDGRAQHSGHDQRSGEDSSLAPHIGDNDQEMTRSEALELEGALAESGYDPGPVDGVIDSNTRAAIRGFQDDHQLAATGTLDPETGELLGIVVFQSS